VIIDTSGAPIQIKRMALSRANSIGVITSPRVPDLSLTKMILKSIKDMPGAENRVTKIIVNKCNASKSDIGEKDIAEALGIDNIVTLQSDATMFAEAENNGEPLYNQNNFATVKSILSPMISEMMGLKLFDNAMQSQMDSGLFAIFNRLKGGT